MRLPLLALGTVVALVAAASPAAAHVGQGMLDDFGGGFIHPLGGIDHLLAMVAVGIWAAQQGGRAVWMLPAAFVGMMALGGSVGLLGGGIGGAETVVLASVLVLGAVVAAALKPPLWLAVLLVGAFALFHGLVHGRELPAAADAAGYAAGFVAATAALHAAGIVLALALRKGAAILALRAAGAAQTGVGALLAFGAL